MVAILDFFKMSISQSFEELQGWNLELKLITPISITGSHFGAMAAILDFFLGGGEKGEVAEGPKGPQPSAGARRSRRPPEPSRTSKYFN